MAMPAAHGLFHRVLTMSGQQATGKPVELATAVARDILDKLGVDPSSRGSLATLRTMPMQQIQEAARTSTTWLPVTDGGVLPATPLPPKPPPSRRPSP